MPARKRGSKCVWVVEWKTARGKTWQPYCSSVSHEVALSAIDNCYNNGRLKACQFRLAKYVPAEGGE